MSHNLLNGSTTAIVESDSAETIKFYWKVSSEQNADYLQFYIDDTLKAQISGEVDWTLASYSVPSGIHTLKWRGACPESSRGIKDGSDYDADDSGWVEPRSRGAKLAPAEAGVQWTGPSPAQDPSPTNEYLLLTIPCGRGFVKNRQSQIVNCKCPWGRRRQRRLLLPLRRLFDYAAGRLSAPSWR